MEGDPTSNSPPSNNDGTKSTENGGSNANATSSAAKKSFKAQSLSSLFQKTASVSSHSGVTQAGSSPKGSGDKVSLMKKSSPTTKNASPVGSQTATLAKSMAPMSTATGTYKLAAMKRDIKSSGSPGSSSNNSPRPENATVWKKPDDHSNSNNVSPIMTAASTIAVSTNEKHEGEDPQTTSITTSQQEDSATDRDTKDMSEEELVKRGIHLTQRLSTSAQRTFNWDEDDEDDWTQSLPLPDIKEPPPPPSPKHEEESSKAAPWVNASLPKPQVVPIAEQIKQLSEQKSQRHQPPPRRRGSSGGTSLQQHQPIQVGKNVPHFNYRLDSKPPPPGPPGPPADDRYRYPDFEKRYRSDVPPPRQELYNANSGTVEPAWRRNRRPTNPEPAPAPAPAPSAEEKKEEEEAIREKQAQVMREAREKARRRKEEELRREEERKAAAKKKADELAARIAERERKAAEEKRRKAEEQQRKKKEAEEAARKKKQEEEEDKKRKKKIAEEEAAAGAQKGTEERGRANAPGNIRSHRSKSSIDENQALRTVSSVLDDERSEHSDKPKLWSEPASATGSRLWNSSDNNNNNNRSAGASPNHGTAAAAGHRKSDELWLPVHASTNRFSDAIGRSGPTVFGTKDDLVLLREQQPPRGNRWDEATSWRRAPSPPEPRENKVPGTPSRGGGGQAASPETTPTSGHRGMSRFFPSPQIEKNNSNNSPEGLNISPWTGSPRTMLLHRESLLPSSNGDKQSNKNWTPTVNTGGGAAVNDTPSSPSRPRVLLPAGENKQHPSTNSSHNPRLPSLDSIQALQSTIAQKLGGKKPANSNVTKTTLPVPESPVVNSIEESSIPFPPLAREERLQKMIMEKEDKRTRQLLQTQSDTVPQQEEEEEEKALSTKLPPATESTDEGERELVLIFDKRVAEPKTDSLRYRDNQGRQTQREYIVDANNPVKVSQVRMPGKSTVTISAPRPRRLGGQWRSRRQ